MKPLNPPCRDDAIDMYALLESLEARQLLSASADITTGLIAHWAFNDGAGAIAADSVGPHNGTLNSGAAFDGGGQFDGGVLLDGANDEISINNHADINLGIVTQRTVSFWFNVDNANDNTRKQVIYEEGGGTRGLNIYVFDSRLYVGGWNATGGAESGWAGTWHSIAIDSGQWHQVALTLDGGPATEADAFKGYLDGEAFGSGDGSQLWGHSGDVTIGRSGNTRFHDGAANGAGHAFAGRIDEGRVYNRALDAIDIDALANTPPIGIDDNYSLYEDGRLLVGTAAGVISNDSDADNDSLLITVLAGPAHGTLQMCNDGSFKYTPHANFYGVDSFIYQIDDGRLGIDTALATITVNPINDAPTIQAPIAQVGRMPITFGGALGNGIRIADVDADGHELRVTLKATNGVLQLGETAGLTFITGDGRSDARMVFTGTVAAINQAVDGMRFVGDAGVGAIDIKVNDRGNTGFDGKRMDQHTIYVIRATPSETADDATNEAALAVIEATERSMHEMALEHGDLPKGHCVNVDDLLVAVHAGHLGISSEQGALLDRGDDTAILEPGATPPVSEDNVTPDMTRVQGETPDNRTASENDTEGEPAIGARNVRLVMQDNVSEASTPERTAVEDEAATHGSTQPVVIEVGAQPRHARLVHGEWRTLASLSAAALAFATRLPRRLITCFVR